VTTGGHAPAASFIRPPKKAAATRAGGAGIASAPGSFAAATASPRGPTMSPSEVDDDADQVRTPADTKTAAGPGPGAMSFDGACEYLDDFIAASFATTAAAA